MTNDFKSLFLRLLKEDDGTDVDVNLQDVPYEDDAWKDTLDPETDPSQFDVPDNPSLSFNKVTIDKAKQWIGKLEEFAEWINGLEEGSLNTQINNLDRDGSVFKGLVRSQEKRLVGIAEDCKAFAEVLKGYVIGAKKKQREINKIS